MSDMDKERRGILLESGTNEVEFLEFAVEGQCFAVNVEKIRQTLVLKDLPFTRMPGCNEIFLGSVHYRDKPIGIINLRGYLKLGGAPAEPSKQLLLVMEFNQKTTGFVIDSVEGIHRMSWESFKPLETSVWNEAQACATGTISVHDRVIVILDLEAMMASIDPGMRIENFAPPVGAQIPTNRKELQIVYAEDSLLVQKVTVKTLKAAGYENITTFPSGAKAMEYLHSAGRKPVDIIISDIEMPEMDGLSFCKSAKGTPGLERVPFLFFSSLVSTEMKRKCASVGGDGSFGKPQIGQLLEELERLCVSTETPRGIS